MVLIHHHTFNDIEWPLGHKKLETAFLIWHPGWREGYTDLAMSFDMHGMASNHPNLHDMYIYIYYIYISLTCSGGCTYWFMGIQTIENDVLQDSRSSGDNAGRSHGANVTRVDDPRILGSISSCGLIFNVVWVCKVFCGTWRSWSFSTIFHHGSGELSGFGRAEAGLLTSHWFEAAPWSTDREPQHRSWGEWFFSSRYNWKLPFFWNPINNGIIQVKPYW